MMKRTGVARLAPDDAPSMQQTPVTIQQQPGVSNMHTLAHTAQPQILAGATTMLSVSGSVAAVGGVGGFGRGRAAGAPVINYLKQSPLQYAAPKQPQQIGLPARIKQEVPLVQPLGSQSPSPAPAQQATQFQRLKVEDALHYLDQVKYKFNTQPQVYNDFLDIMKEFKSQTIDTPGVITRVSNLFKGHPELIVGFNTFLPPGYKIEVQSNGQVSVSMPSPSSLGGGVLVGVHHPPQPQLVHLLPVPQPVNTNAIVHNLSVNAAPANTLHHISQAHQQIEAAAIHHPQGAVQPGAAHAPAPAGQPVEFNHAIEYVNKIKSRFSRQPDKYKRFLEILHAYQRGHRDLKPQNKQQTEQEVYAQVAKLFENQDDLLAEFGQFLPDAKAGAPKAYPPSPPPVNVQREESLERFPPAPPSPPAPHHQGGHAVPKHVSTTPAAPAPHHLKRSPSFTTSTQSASAPPLKRPRPAARDVSVCEAAKSGTAHEYAYFDRVRKALKHQHVYDNFLRCLLLFTREVISSSELLCVTAPFLIRHPDLQRWLHDFVLPNDHSDGYPSYATPPSGDRPAEGKPRYEPVSQLGAQLRHDRPQGDAAMDIDLSTCKRLGTSYCALPRGSADAAARRCSGRTPLCREVLNDTWVSFPTWSEDSTFVTSRKTQYEEYIYRCEDERFELDVVIETNASTIRVLEGVQKKLSRMTPEDAAKYRLDDCLGGHSPTIHQRALRRIYGEKAVDIIAGLKKNPAVAVPVVLRRLKAKEEEWREAQKGFNKQWREQNEKYYLKSLDHQGINFKQNDLKALRSKSLFNEVESAFTARKPGPHVVVDYNVKTRQEAIKVVRDAAELLIHHARRQTAIQKAEKRRIKQILRQFIPDLLNHPKQPLSDDENDEEKEDATSPGSPMDEDLPAAEKGNSVKLEKQESSESDNNSDKSLKNNKNNKENTPKNNNNTDSKEATIQPTLGVKRSSSSEDSMKTELKTDTDLEDDYRDHPPHESRFVCSSSWYLFLRLHGALCQRLAGARDAARAADRGADDDAHRLRLRPHNLPASVRCPADYYPALLELVKAVLDGNMEPSAYEDAAREMFGIKAYPAYTLDKIVSYAVRQLQHCVTECWSVQCYSRGARRAQRAAASYVRRALAERPRHHTALMVTASGGDECKMSFELLEGATDGRTSPLHDSARLSPPTQRAWPPSPPPVFLSRAARRGGAGWARACAPGPAPPPKARRRKPDQQHSGPPLRARLLSGRPSVLYRAGSLSAARASHPRLAARRAERFRAWLRTKRDG